MRRSPPLLGWTWASFSFAATFVALSPCAGAQIIDPYPASLTTYQAAATAIQGVKPQAMQRGVGLDGSMRAGSTFSMAVAGNPFENAWTGHERQGDLRLDTGAFSPTDVDIGLPSAGIPWVIGRSFSSAQKNGASFVDSDGNQGKNWFQTSQPEIVFYDDADNAKDVLYLVYGADRYVEFVRKTSSSNQFKGRNGAAGCFDYQAGSPDIWVLTDTMGTKFYFLGFDTTSHIHDGLLWKIVDTNQNTAFVGDATTVSTAISNGWDGTGRILKAYDASDRRYTYAYTSTSYGGKTRLESVKAETKTGGTWTGTPTGVVEVFKVEYSYYADESHGDGGDLKMVKTTMPLSDSSVTLVKKKLYRYWEGTSDGTSSYGETVNGETAKGYVHQLKYVYESEGLRRYDYAGDANFDEDFLSASDETLKSYASAYFEHDSGHLVSKAWFNGQCGCGGSGNGAHEYTYEAVNGYTNNTGYDTAAATRVMVERPDETYLTQYFDELGQGLSQVITDVAPASYTKFWLTKVTRDSAGCVTEICTPADISGYTHNTTPPAPPTVTEASPAGLVWSFTRESSGSFTGFLLSKRHRTGTGGTAYNDATYTWTSKTKTITDVDVIRPLVATSVVYPLEVTDSTGAITTSYSYTAYSDDSSGDNRAQSLVIETTTTTHPSVASGNNGSGSSVTTSVHRMKDHFVNFERAGDGAITYRAYTAGKQTTLHEDADTTSLSPPSGFGETGTPLDRQTTISYSAQGLPLSSTKFAGWDAIAPVTYRSKLKDERMVTLDFTNSGETQPDYSYYGPVRFTVTNHAGRTEASGIAKLTNNVTTSALTAWVDETDADPITALDLGTVAQMSTSILNDSASQVTESRSYFTLPASGTGTEASNYDATKFGYDDSGRQRRVKEASGTIRRSTFDTLGRTTERWIGTNDSSFSGGEASGTDNMVKTELVEFDGSSTADKGNSYVTERTLRVESTSTGERVTEYTNDVRGRVLLETTPTAPYAFHKYDNMGRRIATGLFSSTASITAASDDPTTETANRLALTQTFFDEAGRVWKSQRHKIDAADGSDDDTLLTLSWYDEDGHTIKVDGPELRKTKYDRLGRVTDEYVLAKDNDSSYSDVSGITGDIVFEEHQTRYNGVRDEVILSVRIDRLNSDYGTNATGEPAGSHTDGKLDENDDTDVLALDDADMRGRAQISAMWYDTYGRITDRVEYGTYNGADFDRDGLSVPARSDTALRTSWFYDTEGRTKYIEDPMGIETFWTYDALGRQLSEVKNWDGDDTDPVPSADSSTGGSAVNVTVKYEYSKGLRTKLIADLPSGSTDQETVYTYGTTKGTGAGDSKIGTGHLLQKVTYPDSGGSSDVVTHAYNAQSQELWKQDQAGNVFEMEFDASGRVTHKRITTLGSGFDGAVRRITTAYDSLGRTSTITQYDNATVGSGSITDEVKYTYEAWGHVEKFEQDRNSAVGASGSVDDYEVSYVYAKQTTGRNTIRCTSMTLPSGKVISYTYLTRNGIYDNPSSRVTEVKDNTVVLALYDYAGTGQVVGTDYTEADVYQKLFEVSTYGDLDRFNRTVKSRWTKELGTNVDFYHVELTYDRNSNITSADDSVHTGFDVKYSMDNTNRLVRAEEGTLSAGSIGSRTRDQQWTLNHTGNWNRDKVDLNGDGDFVDASELDDTRTHNVVNELTARDTDTNSSNVSVRPSQSAFAARSSLETKTAPARGRCRVA